PDRRHARGEGAGHLLVPVGVVPALRRLRYACTRLVSLTCGTGRRWAELVAHGGGDLTQRAEDAGRIEVGRSGLAPLRGGRRSGLRRCRAFAAEGEGLGAR